MLSARHPRPLEILRQIAIAGDPDRHLNEVYLPVEPVT
jgi:hypothetical protein